MRQNTIRHFEQQAQQYQLAGIDGFRAAMTYRRAQQARIDALESEAHCWNAIHDKTHWERRKKQAKRKALQCHAQVTRIHLDRLYSLELRAKRREDRQAWESEGWRVFNVIDSYVFSTQPWPLEYANGAARREIQDLEKLGFSARATVPDYEQHIIHDSYWGTNYGNPSGHVVVLVKAETELKAELIRRTYQAYMNEYWTALHTKYGWALPVPETHLKDWR